MTTSDIVYLACAGVLTLALFYKLRQLHSQWESPRLWALCATLFFVVVLSLLIAPMNAHWVDRVTGRPNFAVVLIVACDSAKAASFMTLALLWRYPAEAAWPRVRRILLAYLLAIVAQTALFFPASVPEEHTTDYHLHYATQPVVAVSVMIWLFALVAGNATLTWWCLTWARGRDYADLPTLRWGLWLYGGATSVALGYDVIQIVAVSANWFGVHALNPVAAGAAIVAVAGSNPLLIAAVLIPAWGRRWPGVRGWVARWRVLSVLWPLHRALRPIAPDLVFVARSHRLDPHHRARRVLIELSDWRWTLAPLFDPAVAAEAERLGHEAGLTGHDLTATMEAAQLKAAAHAWLAGTRPADEAAEQRPTPDEGTRDGTELDELAWWLQVAHAYKHSPIVQSATRPTPHAFPQAA